MSGRGCWWFRLRSRTRLRRTETHVERYFAFPWAENGSRHRLTDSYAPELDTVYWQTGNPCPDHNGDERKGDNLYTPSMVALVAKTGKLK